MAARGARALGVGLASGGYGQDELERAGAYRTYEDALDLMNHLDFHGLCQSFVTFGQFVIEGPCSGHDRIQNIRGFGQTLRLEKTNFMTRREPKKRKMVAVLHPILTEG